MEAAFAIPVLLLILLGTMEFGLVFASGSVTTGSSRSGARLAATSYAPAGSVQSAQLDAADGIAAAFRPYRGRVIQTSLPEECEQALRDALRTSS